MPRRTSPRPTRPLWHHRGFLRLWTGDTISQFGTQISYLAMPLLAVKTLHASTFEVGLLATFETLAFLLVGLPAGAWCDRMRRRPVLIAGDVGRAVLLGSIPLAAVLHHLTLAQLYVVALATGVLTVFFDVSYQSYLPVLVGREHIVDGNGKLESSRAVSQVAGPSVGGFLVQVFTAPYAILVDALSFAWSAAWILAIRTPEPAPERPEQRDLGKEIAEGLRYVLGHPILRKIAGCTGSFNLCTSAEGAVIVLFFVRKLHLSAGTIGVLLSLGSIGGVLGAATVGAATRRIGQARMIWLSVSVTAPFALLVPLTGNGWRMSLFAIGFFVTSVGVIYYNVAQVSFRQAITPNRLLGRMNATMRFLVWGTMPLGGLLGGALGTTIGLRPTLWVFAVGQLLAALWVVFSPLLHMRDVTATGPDGGPAALPVSEPAPAPPPYAASSRPAPPPRRPPPDRSASSTQRRASPR